MNKVLLTFATLALSAFTAHADITSIFSVTAEVQFDGNEATQLTAALENAGFAPRQDGFVELANISFVGHRNTADFSDANSPCYQKPQYTLTFTYAQDGSANAGKTVTVNPTQSCEGDDNEKAATVYNAVIALGAEGDAAMGGEFGLSVSQLMCYTNIHSVMQCAVIINKEVNLKN